MRIVSLLPSATEIVGLVGAGGMLVGRSHECDFPVEVRALPILTGPRTPVGASAAEIDAEVSRRLREGQSLYTLDVELLHRLQPDLILTQDLCRVCSIDLETVRGVAAEMDPPPRVLSLNPLGLEDVIDDVLRVGEAVGRVEAAGEAVVRLRERLWRAADYVNPYVDGPRVLFLEWTDPMYVGGHWTPQLIERAGGRHPMNPTRPDADAGAAAGPQAWASKAGPSVRVAVEAVVAMQPEAVIVCPCGVGLEGTREMVQDLEQQAWWRKLPAVENGRVALVDGNQMFNRPGPRLVEAYEWLVGWLNERRELMPVGFPWELRRE
ncbi:MAG: ABC transporter substrate-binding protein [Phycisphaeraceae bacterium]|nr:ABC transporter substrate-binding protein [Phycisphaeraceae bacterium]